jgi:5-(carboxyamino)imidazole ribonucleotide synthase
MLQQAAINYPVEMHYLDPDPEAPCAHLSDHFVQGSLLEWQTVYDFGKDLDVVTIEIETVNTDALEALQDHGVQVYPQPYVVRTIQDKRTQKQFFRDHNLPTSPYINVNDLADARAKATNFPIVHKTAKGGYDGRGVNIVRTKEELAQSFDSPGLLEELVDIEMEVAVIVTRNSKGQKSVFPAVEMVFHPEHNLLDYLVTPAMITEDQRQQIKMLAEKTADYLGIIGVLAIEFFISKDGTILINEMAPRTHNSGHHTIEANFTSQFQQHMRVLLDLQPGKAEQIFSAGILNLIGEPDNEGPVQYYGIEELYGINGVYPHIYGKRTTKPARKMGHITVVGDSRHEVIEKIERIKGMVKVYQSE